MQKHPDKTDLRDQLIRYMFGQSDFSARDLQELLNNIFSPVLKQEIMITGTGFLAVAAREAAANERAKAQKQADRAAKKTKLIIEALQKDAEKTRQDAEKTRQDAEEKIRQEVLLRKQLMVMYNWHRELPFDVITDIADLPHDAVRELIATFEKIKTHTYSKTNVDTKELIALSGLTEVEVKALLTLLQK